MSDQELAVDEVDIGFHAAEAVIQRVQQWACVLIIIMGVGMYQRDRFRARRQRGQ